jgi:hypothetical protein
VPHVYQRKGVEHLVENPVAALFFDPGLGKTSITLEAFRQLHEEGVARRMLVVAPLRVCQLVWRQEAQQWTQFRHLRFSLIHGSPKKKQEALEADADIYLINPEGIAWLTKELGRGFGRQSRWPFDTVCIDELTKFKNDRAKRHKQLREYAWQSARRWGLTGTPIPNGYLDLFGQIKMLDEGRALGRFITHYRDRFFKQGWTGFDWELREGSAEKIEELIRPYVLRMSAEDWLELPERVDDIREIELAPAQLKKYRELKKEMVVLLEESGERVTAENAGGIHSKLKQMANGAVYIDKPDGTRKYVHIHDLKLDALEELREELQGQQLLVGYEFQHDLERLLERFPDTPYLAGASDKKAQEIEEKWNAGEIDMLFAHPASAGHGLNFQKSSAGHLCWFSVTVDLELYLQFLMRILRQGNKRARVINHALVVKNTVDELSKETVDGKAVTQARFLQALGDELGIEADQGDDDMPVKKLRRKAEVEETEEAAPKKKGWGRRASEEDEDDEDEEPEEEAPRRRRSVAKAEAKRSRVAGDEDEDSDDDEDEDEDEKPGFSRRTRRRLEEADEDDDSEEQEDEDEDDDYDDGPGRAGKSKPSRPPEERKRRAVKPKAEPEPEEADEGEKEEADEPPFEASDANSTEAGNAVAFPTFGVDECRRGEALRLARDFADRLGLGSEAQIIKAAKEFEKYLRGEK